MFFIGVTRFSLFYPNASGWNLTGRLSSPRDYEQMLFSPARLTPRVEIFLNLSLPQLERAASGFPYRHVVQISPQLPSEVKQKLRAAEERYSFLVVSEHSSAKAHRQDLERVVRNLAEVSDSADGLFARFRLDDDDILGVNYFQQLASYVTVGNIGINVSFGRGFQAAYYGGTIFDLRKLYHPRNSMGMAQICRLRSSGRIESTEYSNHARSDLEVPTILDSRTGTVLSLKHNGQDTFANEASGEEFDKATRLLSREEPASYENLALVFPELTSACLDQEMTEVQFDNCDLPVELTTEAKALRLDVSGPAICEFDFTYETSDRDDEKRLFIAMPFVPAVLQYPWSKFQTESVVAGSPFSDRGVTRIPLLLSEGERLQSATIWQSRAASKGNVLKGVSVRGRMLND